MRLILRTAPGVDDVTSWGGQERQYQVRVDPLKLIKHQLGFKEVIAALQANNGQVGGNFIDVGREQFLVRGLGLVKNAQDIGRIVLKSEDGTPVYVRDVADVVEGGAPRFGAVTRDGKEVVMGMALSRIGENAKSVVDAVKAKLDTAKAALPDGVVIEAGLRAHRSRQQGGRHRGARARRRLAARRARAVPVPRRIAFGARRHRRVAAGDADRLHRHAVRGAFGEPHVARGPRHRHRHDGRRRRRRGRERVPHHGRAQGARRTRRPDRRRARGAREVANPVAFAIGIIIVVFLPLFSLEGLEGKLFKPMALNISFAMGGSLLLALTLIPVLAALILKPKEEKDTRLVAWLKRGYAPVLAWALARKRTLGIAGGALLASLALFPFLGKEFMPQLQEGSIMWRVTSIPSTSLDESIDVSKRIAEAFKQFPEVDTTLSR